MLSSCYVVVYFINRFSVTIVFKWLRCSEFGQKGTEDETMQDIFDQSTTDTK